MMNWGDICVCGCCGGSELVWAVVSLFTESMRSVLGDYALEGTGLTEFSDVPSDIRVWLAKYTACVTTLLESVLDSDRAALLTLSLFSMVSAWYIPVRFFQLFFTLVLLILWSQRNCCAPHGTEVGCYLWWDSEKVRQILNDEEMAPDKCLGMNDRLIFLALPFSDSVVSMYAGQPKVW